jgi:hypothetical protein
MLTEPMVGPISLKWLADNGVEIGALDMYMTSATYEIDGMFRSVTFQVQQLTPTLTIVNGEQFDEHGFVLCGTCRNYAGSEHCCTRDYDQAVAYMEHYGRVFGQREQAAPAEIVDRCPVNVCARAAVTR